MVQNVARVLGPAPAGPRPQRDFTTLRRCPRGPAISGARRLPSHSRIGSRPFYLDGQVCGLLAVDIVGFGEPCRDDDVRLYVHRALYDVLEAAFDSSGVPWAGCVHEDRGDGALVVVPPSISVAGLLHPIPDKLLVLLRRHNRVSCDAAGIRLRVAMHVGPVHHDGHGFVGHDVNHLYRMLDAPALRRMLKESGAEIGYITSRYVYENVVTSRPSLVSPDVFKPVTVRVKETRERAWAYVLGGFSLSCKDSSG